ncbi:lasso peptide biosynthesis B2 protein [Pseudoxanthomonas winnipegensis]|jgi:hypothetical protein|uniref:Lasso peptide biosynthesis B2 protein n=2 Tax=Pseudoxanthomonas winnipegensis TaxID=2480810 RepID=A0ABY1WAV8_9GAMM|nr:lasso peptide biosynthesis B2 protein [Pseudoxanthomonas winnipegensis]TAA17663.1 lasso peptide biosynthesis B2 protein [Pseudoxanthomonas winnipegensis]TAH71382.1 lasso peptide biosynthesis B2 protein [Pseudoxanthomonas winnipegensis]
MQEGAPRGAPSFPEFLMKRLKQSQDVSYCHYDDRLIFLDTSRDRYFQISQSLERHFLEFVASGETDATSLIRLTELEILVRGDTGTPNPTQLPRPARSALEQREARTKLTSRVTRDVFTSLIAMQWRLKHWRLKEVLALLAYRENEEAVTSEQESILQTHEAIAASIAFQRVRPFVPVAPCCLVDSLALAAFMTKRGIRTHLVFAVACDPFSAHAWTQYDDVVLNDTTGNVLNYVPIRVI